MVAKGKKNFVKRHKVLTALLLIVTALTCLFAYAFSNLNPIMIRMAEARARQLAVQAINRAVDEVMDTSLRYADLVTVVTDNNGNIAMLEANTMLMNDLASQAALAAQRNLADLANQGVELPLGSALGIGLFSGSGPRFRVNVVPVGSVTMKFITAFETAGINQTRHEISLESTVLMRIVIPTGANSVQVSAYVPIAESIIVGQVPQSYVNVPDVDSMLNLIP